MKILMATMGLDIGGAETHIVELSKELRRRGHEVIIASNGGVYVPEIEAAGIRHVKIPMHLRSPRPMLQSYFLLRRLIRAERPDIVHAHARIPGFLCGLLHKTMRFPFVTTAHWVFDTSGGLRFLTNWGQKTIAVSDDIKEYLISNYGTPSSDIFVTINGVDTEKFSPSTPGDAVRAEFGLDAKRPVVSHVSRIDQSRERAAFALAEAARELDARLPGIQILIAGSGDKWDELKARADAVNAEMGRKCIFLAGARTDVNEIIAAGDVFVGVSRAALEAMSCGKPTVLAGNEGFAGLFAENKLQDAIDCNFCCRGCPEITTSALVSSVLEAVGASGEYGREVVKERYSVERMASDAERAYFAAAAKPKRVVMSGYYGFGNAGDDAIMRSIYDSAVAAGATEITVLSKNPRETTGKYAYKAVNRFNIFAVRKAIRRSALLISGGGSLLQDRTSTRSILYYLWIIRQAERMGKKVMLYSNGIGPVSKPVNRRRVKTALDKADVITLRDADSAAELREMGIANKSVSVTADPVFLLHSEKCPAFAEKPFAIVSLRHWNGLDVQKMADFCDRLHTELGLNIVFAPMQRPTDAELSRGIAEKMSAPSSMLPEGMSPGELVGAFEQAELVVAMRLHALIFAAGAATPTVGIVYDPKLQSCLHMLDMPSAGEVPGFDPETALAVAGEALKNRERLSGEMAARRDALKAKAAENEIFLKRLLK